MSQSVNDKDNQRSASGPIIKTICNEYRLVLSSFYPNLEIWLWQLEKEKTIGCDFKKISNTSHSFSRDLLKKKKLILSIPS